MTVTLRIGGLVLFLSLLGSGGPAAANVYHWTDQNGVRHYTNTRPPQDAEAVEQIEEIPYDPETDGQRRAEEDALLQEREDAELRERIEAAEREAREARRQAEEAKRRADRLAKEIEERDDDPSYGIYYPARRPPGWRPPGHRPPGQRPPAWRPRPKPSGAPHQEPSQPPQQTPRGKNAD
jgi:hypothetical protein